MEVMYAERGANKRKSKHLAKSAKEKAGWGIGKIEIVSLPRLKR